MTDIINEEVTTEEVTEPTVAPTPEEAPPALTDEQLAAALGVDVEYLKEVKPQIKNLNGFYGKVNKKNVELIEAQRALEARAATPTAPTVADDDDDLELDEKSKRVLLKLIEEQMAPFANTVKATVEAEMGTVIEAFADANPTVDASRIDDVMSELGLWDSSRTPAALKKNLDRAKRIVAAESFDPEAEAERIAAEKLKGAVKEGERVVDVKSKRAAIETPRDENSIIVDNDIPWYKRMEAFSKTE